MEIEKRLGQLTEQGAVAQVPTQGGLLEVTLAAAALVPGPALRWCGIWPEHQGHVYTTRYTKAQLGAGGRDIYFYRGGNLVVGVTTLLESGLNTDEAQEALQAWRAALAGSGAGSKFEEFFQTA